MKTKVTSKLSNCLYQRDISLLSRGVSGGVLCQKNLIFQSPYKIWLLAIWGLSGLKKNMTVFH